MLLPNSPTIEEVEIDRTPVAPDDGARTIGLWALILAPVVVPVYLALVFIVFSFAADAWNGLRASLGI